MDSTNSATRLTVRQALTYVQPPISRATLYRLLAEGRVKAVKRGRNTLIESDSLDRYARELPVAQFRAPRKAA